MDSDRASESKTQALNKSERWNEYLCGALRLPSGHKIVLFLNKRKHVSLLVAWLIMISLFLREMSSIQHNLNSTEFVEKFKQIDLFTIVHHG